jgi:hypothetical protein
MKQVLIIAVLVFLCFPAIGQEAADSVIVTTESDTALIKSYAKRYNPRKALLFAAVVPGLGQIYNKKYWKLPLVYGGMYMLGKYGIKFYTDLHKEYKAHLFYNLEHNLRDPNDINPTTNFTTSQLRRVIDKYRRERDFMVILMGGVYLLQMIDAHVDAHLKEFDLNPNLRVSIEPSIQRDAVLGKQSGVSLVFRF